MFAEESLMGHDKESYDVIKKGIRAKKEIKEHRRYYSYTFMTHHQQLIKIKIKSIFKIFKGEG